MDWLECDYMELERIRGRSALPQRRTTSSRSLNKQLRSAHLKFVYKIYIISLLLVMGLAAQWWFISEIKLVQELVILYNYDSFDMLFVLFLLLVFLQFVLRYKKSRSKTVVFIYTFILVEFSSITIARPMVESFEYTALYASSLTLAVFVLSLILASINLAVSERRNPLRLSLWSQKGFLATTLSLLMTWELRLDEIQIGITIFLMLFIFIIFIIWGRLFGSVKFYKAESSYLNYYIVLNFLNTVAFFANALVFFEKIKNVT